MLTQPKLRPIAPLCVGDVVDYVPRASPVEHKTWMLGHSVGKSDARISKALEHFKIDCYYPQIREFRPVALRHLSQKQRAAGLTIKRPVLVPLLPRYRLIHVDPSRPDLESIFQLAGIGGLVCEGGTIIRVPQSFIDHVRRTEREGAIPGETSARLIFTVGELVRIGGSGPFAGHNAAVDEEMDIPIEELDADRRIRIAIRLLGRLSALELPICEVERLQPR